MYTMGVKRTHPESRMVAGYSLMFDYLVRRFVVFVPLVRSQPSPGPHLNRECLPLVIIIRNRLKYALTMSEANMICMQKLIKVRPSVIPRSMTDVIRSRKHFLATVV